MAHDDDKMIAIRRKYSKEKVITIIIILLVIKFMEEKVKKCLTFRKRKKSISRTTKERQLSFRSNNLIKNVKFRNTITYSCSRKQNKIKQQKKSCLIGKTNTNTALKEKKKLERTLEQKHNKTLRRLWRHPCSLGGGGGGLSTKAIAVSIRLVTSLQDSNNSHSENVRRKNVYISHKSGEYLFHGRKKRCVPTENGTFHGSTMFYERWVLTVLCSVWREIPWFKGELEGSGWVNENRFLR